MAEFKENVYDFEDIVNGMYREEMDRIHVFNVMLVGLSGFGKSSLVRSLFRGRIRPKEVDGGPVLNEYQEIFEENGVKTKLRCIETSNFRTHQPRVYLDYIEDKLRNYFVELRRRRKQEVEDSRVHCCLYLIPPHGKMRLEDEDIECMKALHDRVNLVPIIPKSEFFDSSQKAKFKENIMTDLKRHGIKYFVFSYDEKIDEDQARIVKQDSERFPFAVVATDEPVVENGRSRWIRKTDSCTIDIRDRKYDFEALSQLLIRYCQVNLVSSTHKKHYRSFISKLLNRAQREGFEILKNIGLEGHEILRIQYELDADRDLDEEMRVLQQKSSSNTGYQQQSQSPKKQIASSPQTVRPPKPPILNEKPEYLRSRVSELYRSRRA